MFRKQTADAAQQVTEKVTTVVQSKAAIHAAATGGEQAVRELADGMTTEEIGRVIDQLKR
ncbi:hypothetical protein ACGF0C_29325 [Streptomyces albidoflavus]|uniref:hypothetical protein n=1 Tax=Streptomyces TaxID=1883 RepID=UPI0001AED2A7|nr:hypothetical protein [Streptomyces albidoflavus]BDH51585.1 hypothetical protein MTP02_25960 [Streptomyces albus]AGI88901.1 Hypothetical protein XNR_2530 [Streptomyces albidoflavus]EFE82955.1 predicted protein [Streptomyces albidoflavus]PJT47905.1 hypothetical protein CWI85_25485 [Streptomyces albidoflavus]QLP92672.1 Hypothetical protein XNRR2_2530 [Streptomyces albidoflavus]